MRILSADCKFKDLITWIYFVQCKAEPSLIKIGISGNIESRFGQLNRASPLPLNFLGAVRSFDFFESALHELFACERRHGEWFEPSDRIVSFVSSLVADYGGRQIPAVSLIEMMGSANLEGKSYAMLAPWFIRAASIMKGIGGAPQKTGYRRSDMLFLEKLGLVSKKPGPSSVAIHEASAALYVALECAA